MAMKSIFSMVESPFVTKSQPLTGCPKLYFHTAVDSRAFLFSVSMRGSRPMFELSTSSVFSNGVALTRQVTAVTDRRLTLKLGNAASRGVKAWLKGVWRKAGTAVALSPKNRS
jgi:hypothetical protein